MRKTAKRWLARNAWEIAAYKVGVSKHHPKSAWVKTMRHFQAILGDIRFLKFSI